uniref:Putative gustatory receptor 6 n=1 Tax=Conopomorpha sinensis TaxID=940481 RepID=A0A3S7SGP3_9NEOP|nr:putative gustatory receptor 6 [Conopomorpha sinensis]
MTVRMEVTNNAAKPNDKTDEGFPQKKTVSWIPSAKSNKVRSVEPKPAGDLTAANFQRSLKITLIAGQIFALLPVRGILTTKPSEVWFKRLYWKCFYTYICLFGQMFMTVMCINNMAHNMTSLKSTSPIIFYATTCFTTIIFYNMAKAWPKLVADVANIEQLDPCTCCRPNLVTKCNATCCGVLFLALIEHILSLLLAFASAGVCFPNLSLYEGFVKHFYPWVFNFLPYHGVLGFMTQFVHFQSTFIWNFSDLFVICISYFLTYRLQHVNKKLLNAQGKYLPETFWKATREEYGRVTKLIRRMDDVIGGVVFISFANNLFFICFQLFNTLENGLRGSSECTRRTHEDKTSLLGGSEAAAYFIFSLVYLIMRSVMVSLVAAQVNTESMVPAPVLYDVPSPVYCTEVQRFLDQVNGEVVALTGLKFFSVTRGLLLTVAGTIVTYELVMVQFNAPSPSSSSPTTTALPSTVTNNST